MSNIFFINRLASNLLRPPYSRPCEGKPHLTAIAHLISLEFAHCQQTFTNTLKLHQTHPLVFSILLPFNIQDWAV